MSNRTLDAALSHQQYVEQTACCECGFHRNGTHHANIRCSKTGRCGDCGNDWPCPDHPPRFLPGTLRVIHPMTTPKCSKISQSNVRCFNADVTKRDGTGYCWVHDPLKKKRGGAR